MNLHLLAGSVLLLACGLAACTPSEKAQDASGLRSDIPLREPKYLVANPAELQEIVSMCSAWKGSQRPFSSWPSVVVENCNNADDAKRMKRAAADREKFKREMGI